MTKLSPPLSRKKLYGRDNLTVWQLAAGRRSTEQRLTDFSKPWETLDGTDRVRYGVDARWDFTAGSLGAVPCLTYP